MYDRDDHPPRPDRAARTPGTQPDPSSGPGFRSQGRTRAMAASSTSQVPARRHGPARTTRSWLALAAAFALLAQLILPLVPIAPAAFAPAASAQEEPAAQDETADPAPVTEPSGETETTETTETAPPPA